MDLSRLILTPWQREVGLFLVESEDAVCLWFRGPGGASLLAAFSGAGASAEKIRNVAAGYAKRFAGQPLDVSEPLTVK